MLYGAISALTLLCASNLNAQSVKATNDQWPVGRYKMRFPGVDSDENTGLRKNYMELCLLPNNQFQFVIAERGAEAQLQIGGTYRKEGTQLRFTPEHTSDMLATVFAKPGKKSNKVQLVIDQTEYRYGSHPMFVYVGSHADVAQFKTLEEYAEEGKAKTSEEDGLTRLTLPAGDSLYLRLYHGNSAQVVNMAYAIPSLTDSLYIRSKEDQQFYEDWKSISGRQGETPNEILLKLENKAILALYYMGELSSAVMAGTPVAPGKDYVYQTAARWYVDTVEGILEHPPVVDAVATPAVDETLPYETNLAAAREKARRENKMLVLYYEPSNCKTCGTPFEDMAKAASEYGYYGEAADTFKRNIVLYKAGKEDRNLFRPYGIKAFPALVVLSSDEKQAAYYTSGSSLSRMSYRFFSVYQVQRFRDEIENQRLSERIAKGPISKVDAMAYINQSLDGTDVVAVAEPASYDGETEVYPAAGYDEIKEELCWNKLLNDYKILETPDTNVLRFLYRNGRYLDGKDAQKPEPALDYAIRFYPQLNGFGGFASAYDEPKTLYAWIAEMLAPREYDSATVKQELSRVIDAQMRFMAASPVAAKWYGPVLMSNMTLADELMLLKPEWEQAAIKYCNQFPAGQQALKTTIAQMVMELKTQQPAVFPVALSQAANFSVSPSDQEDIDDANLMMELVVANVLNNYAWHCYEYKPQEVKPAQVLQWSETALQLEPRNPYFLDTYAHLLYRNGRKADAVKTQQQAIDAANDKKNRTYMEKEAYDNLKVELKKMKEGKI